MDYLICPFNAQILLNAHPVITKMSAEVFFQASCQTARDSDRRMGVLKIYHTYVAKHMWKQAGSNDDPCFTPIFNILVVSI